MATIVTRTGKGSALTFTEADDNFTNLNNDGIANSTAITNLQNDKLDKAGGTVTGTLNVNGNLTLGSKVIGSSGNNSQSGTAVTLSGISTEIVRLTNSSLVSIAGASGAASGQKLVLVNQTGVNVTILNDSVSAPAGEKIFTGNGSDVLLQQNASISFVYDNSSSRWQLIGGTGSGGGSSGINYIVNSDASTGTTGYTTYNDSAAAPVDGSGGTPAAGLWVRSTTTPLRGSGDFNLVKTGSTSYQGNGVAYDFTIDNADLARVLTVSFDYEVVSGTYATGDLTVYLIQDPTGTPVVIQPAGYQVVAATAGTKMTQIATFQTDSSQKNYRLCFHVATTSALDYTLALDNIVVGPTQKVYGAPVTDWISYTPTIGSSTGSVTNATATARYRRVGDSIEGEATITFSAASAAFTLPNITLPAGLFGDTSKIPDNDTDRGIGICSCLDSGTTIYGPWVVGYDSTTNKILAKYAPVVNATSASTIEPLKGGNIANNFPFTFGANDKIFISWKFPILGWSSNVEVSSSTDTRVVAARITGTSTSIPPTFATSKISLTTVSVDKTASWDSVNNRYVIPVSGTYRITAHNEINFGLSNNIYQHISSIRVNTTEYQKDSGWVTTSASFSGGRLSTNTEILDLKAGDTVELYGAHNSSAGGNRTPASAGLLIERLSGPSQIAASETVACEYNTAAGGSLGNGANTFIDFGTKETDSHGSVVGAGSGNNTTYTNTWRFVAPLPGRYQVNSVLNISFPASTGCDSILFVTVNGNFIARGSRSSYTTPTTGEIRGIVLSQIVKVNAGDAISIVCYQDSGGTRTLETSGSANRISIVRVGN